MLKLTQEIDTAGAAIQLSRINNIIYAYDGKQDLVEVDMKHQLIMRNKLPHPPRNVRCFNWEGALQYFVVTLNKIERAGHGMMSESNSKAEFTGPIDCHGDSLLFAKYHTNYRKHSINYLYEGNKKIVKLSDQPIKKLIFNPITFQVIYSLKDTVSCFDLQDPQKEVLLFKKSAFLHDSYNLYYLSLNLENQAKEEYQCGIFDFRNGKLADSWVSKEPPIKIQSFSRTLLVASANAIELYDIRKLIKPFERQSIKGVKDFLYEPNLNKLYLGCDNRLRVYRMEY